MKVSTKYERVTRQMFTFDQSDIRKALEKAAREGGSWCKTPDGCVEAVETSIKHDPNDNVIVTTVRTFTREDYPVVSQESR